MVLPITLRSARESKAARQSASGYSRSTRGFIWPAMPQMAAVFSRANYPPAVIYYAIAACLPVAVMLVWRAEPLSLATLVLAAMFFTTVSVWTRY